MRKQAACIAALLALTSSAALAQSSAPPPPMGPKAMADMAKSPGAYVTAAGESDKFEITEGQMAETMATSPQIKAFGQKMVRDHTKSTAKVMMAAKVSGLPRMPPPVLRPDQQDMVAQLKMASGPAFDQLYVQQQTESHQQALMVQQNYAEHGTAPALKAAAKKIVPVVKDHLSMLQSLSSST